MFTPYLTRWNLIPNGSPIISPSSQLLPVLYKNTPAMLKIATIEEEKRGNLLMVWWEGKGAVPILKHDSNALLMEYAQGNTSLTQMVRDGQDNEASRIICSVAAQLHTPKDKVLPKLIPLSHWFKSLNTSANVYGGILQQSATIAKELLATPQDITVLHGDLHHGNILNAGERGWLAIDPKGLIGERGFDFANIFCNPDMATATAPGRLARQLDIVAEAAGLERKRLLQWIVAYAGLSAAWFLEDTMEAKAQLPLKIAQLAAAKLRTC